MKDSLDSEIEPGPEFGEQHTRTRKIHSSDSDVGRQKRWDEAGWFRRSLFVTSRLRVSKQAARGLA